MGRFGVDVGDVLCLLNLGSEKGCRMACCNPGQVWVRGASVV